MAEQEAELKRQLEDSEIKLYQYKKDRNLLAVSLDDKQSMLSQNLANVNAKLTELRIRLIEVDAKRKMIERARINIADEETLPEIREKATMISAAGKPMPLTWTATPMAMATTKTAGSARLRPPTPTATPTARRKAR